MNPAFLIAQQTANNLGNSFKEVQEKNAIDQILSNAMQSGDEKGLQDAMTQILSSVSPERQPIAVKFLESRLQNLSKQEDMNKKIQAAKEGGYDVNAPAGVQTQQVKDKAKNARLSQYYPEQSNVQPSQRGQQTPKNEQNPTSPPNLMQPPAEQKKKQFPNDYSTDELVVLQGHPDKEVSEPAKATIQRRTDEEKLNIKRDEAKIKRHTDISQDIIKESEKDANELIQTESALDLMEQAIANQDLSFFSPDNIAEVTGIEAFRTPEGALFKTAGKEFFLGNLTRAGARPNQFIEKQIVEMLPKMGRSTAANLSVARAFRNEIDLKKEKLRLTRELSDELEEKLGYVPRNLGQLRDEKLKVYAEAKQKELNNDLRAYKSIEEKVRQPFLRVEDGTPISKVVAKALLDQYEKKDPDRKKKAAKDAKDLGYTF